MDEPFDFDDLIDLDQSTILDYYSDHVFAWFAYLSEQEEFEEF